MAQIYNEKCIVRSNEPNNKQVMKYLCTDGVRCIQKVWEPLLIMEPLHGLQVAVSCLILALTPMSTAQMKKNT